MKDKQMASGFELFDIISGNVVDVYECESDAIAALVELARESGLREIARFALLCEQEGESTLVAMKDALVLRVEAEQRDFVAATRGSSNGDNAV
jgi:hypothetical protein